MALRRSSLLLLGAVLALLGLPASALAQGDPTLPVNTTAATPGAWQTSPYVVTLQGTDVEDPAVDMEWQLGPAGAITSWPSGTQITIPTLGVLDFRTQAVDDSGNTSGWRSETLRIDTVDPTDASAATTPAGTSGWHLAATSFDVSAVDITSGVDHVEWILDGGAVQSGPNGSNVPISANGVHLLRTRAVDVAGNVSDWTDHTVRIDAVLPTDTTNLPTGWRTTPVDVTVKGVDAHSGVDEVEWVVDGGAPATDSPEGAFTIAADGEHTVQTLVRDVAGNETAWKSHTVKIDTTDPDNLTDVSDGEWTQAYHVQVEAGDATSGVDRVEWRIDSGPWQQGPSGSAVNITQTGVYTLTTRARDHAGNVSADRQEIVRVDATLPTNTTLTPPSGEVSNPYDRAVTGDDDDSGVASIEWRVNGGAITSGDPGDLATVTGPTNTYTLETRIIDEAGNASAWRADSVNINAALGDNVPPVDTTAPAATTAWFSDPVSVTVQAVDTRSGVTQLQYRRPGETLKTVTGPTQVLLDKEGPNVLETRAKDGADPANWSAWRTQTYKIDLSLPVDTTDIPDGWQDSNSFVLSGTDARSGVDEIGYEIDGGGEQFGNPGQTVTVPGGDGSYEITTRVIDNAGHSSDYTTQTLKVDTVDPVNTSDVPDTDWIKGSLALALSGTDLNLAPMQWRVDEGEIQNGDTATIDEDGEFLLETRAIDLAGNFTAWRPHTVKVDATVPVNTTPAAPAGWRKTAYSVAVTGNDGAGSGVDRIERKVDGGAVSNDPNVTVTGDGVHTLSSRIIDEVGYESTWRDDVIRIDTVKPTAAVSCSAAADVWSTAPVACTVSANGGISGIGSLWLAGADGGTKTVTSGTVATVSADGTHTVRLDAADGAGNAAAAQAVVNVDRTAPVATLTCAAQGRAHSCRADASDATSGLASLAWSVDGGDFKAIGAGESFSVTSGKVTLRAIDAAGNQLVTEPVTLKQGATVRVTNAPVYLKGRKNSESLVGALSAARSASGTVSLDLRPLAVGRGRFRVEVRLKSGKRSRTVKRTVKVGRTGTLPRMSASLSRAIEKTTVTLTVRKRTGRRWKAYAGTRFVLAK